MKKINRQRNDYAILKSIRDHLTLEELSEFIICIEEDSKKFLERLIVEFTPEARPDLVIVVNDNNDLCNLNVKDFIDYIHTKRENPVEKLIEIYKILSKNILPTAERQSLFLYIDSCFNSNSRLNLVCSSHSNICEITGNFKSIAFEQIPEYPIGIKGCFHYKNPRSLISIIQPEKLYFDKWSCETNITIQAKDNLIELSL